MAPKNIPATHAKRTPVNESPRQREAERRRRLVRVEHAAILVMQPSRYAPVLVDELPAGGRGFESLRSRFSALLLEGVREDDDA